VAGSPSSVGRQEAIPSAQAPVEQRAPAGLATAAAPWLWAVPAFATLALTLWEIRTPSYSVDETFTMSAVQRPFGALLRMLAHIDAVHGAYYLMLWPLVRLFGPGELVTRLPSAVAMAAAAAAVSGVGRRLVSTRAGLAAGLVFAVVPAISYYGQTARPYGLATALAAIASYLLVRAIQAADAGNRVRGWLVGYGACLVALGCIHLFALLLAGAHAFPVARTWRRHRATGRGRLLAAGWAISVAAAFVLVSPVALAALAQIGESLPGQNPPWNRSVGSLEGLVGTARMAAVAWLVVGCALAAGAASRRPRVPAPWPADLIALAVPWLVLPPAMLIGTSQLVHVYTFRYVVFCVPAAALLLGAAASALGWLAGTAAVAALSVLAVPTLLAIRTPTGHDSDFGTADEIIARNIRPGDVLMYPTVREPVQMAYPYGMRQLSNVEQAEPPITAQSLGGTFAKRVVVWWRLTDVSRVWYVQLAYGHHQLADMATEPAMLTEFGFKPARIWHLTGIWVSLYARR
jgi:mannosyltransferase